MAVDSSLYPLIAAGVSAAAKGVTAARQRRDAKKLKESKFIPEELLMNKDLAQLQAFSRQSPGQAKAEQMVRRNQANTVAAAKRASGGNLNKITAASVAAQGAANDATDRIHARGNEFSENAYRRIQDANTTIAAQKTRNRSEFNRAKIDLLAASDQNYMQGFNDLLEGAMASAYMNQQGGKPATASTSTGITYSQQGNIDPRYGRYVGGRFNKFTNPWMVE